MFSGCESLTTLGDLSNFAKATGINSLNSTFYNTPQLADQTTADSLASWHTDNVTDMIYTFLNNGFQKLDLSNWKTSKVGNFASAFSKSAVKDLNLNGWDFSRGGVIGMFASLKNPAHITMNDITLPTDANRFKISDFVGNQPLVIISNHLPLSLNEEKQANGTQGRQNTNKLTFTDKKNSAVLGTKPLDFVYSSNEAFKNAIKAATSKYEVKRTIGADNGAKWDPQSKYDLTDNSATDENENALPFKVLHTANLDNPEAFVDIVTGKYALTMDPVRTNRDQQIIYRTKDGQEIGRTTVNVPLTNGILSADDANQAIDNGLPAGYLYVSGKLATDLDTDNDNGPIMVTVEAAPTPDPEPTPDSQPTPDLVDPQIPQDPSKGNHQASSHVTLNDQNSNGGQASASVSNSVAPANQDKKASQATLPQTGNHQNQLAVVGLGLAGMLSLLGFGLRKKQD